MVNPLPWSLLLLWLAVPGIWLGAGILVDWLPTDRGVRRSIRPAVALAAWIVGVQTASMALHSFWLGMPVGMCVVSALGGMLWLQGRSSKPSIEEGGETGYSRAMWLSMLLVTLPFAVIEWNGHFHDDRLPIGSMANVAQIQNDYFPPRILGFPHLLFAYHYGVDLVCAGLTALTRCPVDLAIRIVTVFGWAYSWLLLWMLGERLTGARQGGFWTALAALLGGGAAIFVAPLLSHVPWTDRLLGTATLGTGVPVDIWAISYMFNHRFSIGMPLGISLLLVAIEPAAGSAKGANWARNWTLGMLLAALYMAQVAYFAAFSATLFVTEVLLARRWRFLLALGGAWLAAWLMGGMLFTHNAKPPPNELYFSFWPTAPEENGASVKDQAFRVLAWHAAAYGALLPLGIWGLWRVQRLRVALLLLVAGGLAVQMFFKLRHTANIIKFSMTAELALAILTGALLTWFALKRTLVSRVVLAGCVVALVAAPLAWLVTVLSIQFVSHDVPWYYAGPTALGSDDMQAIGWLRLRVKPDGLVYRNPDLALGYLQWGGLPTPFVEYKQKPIELTVWPEQMARTVETITTKPPELDAYRSLGIEWFVVGPDDPRMQQNAAVWQQAGQIVKVADFGALKVYRIRNTAEPAANERL